VYACRLLPAFRRNLIHHLQGRSEDGGSRFLRNSGNHLQGYKSSRSRQPKFKFSLSWKSQISYDFCLQNITNIILLPRYRRLRCLGIQFIHNINIIHCPLEWPQEVQTGSCQFFFFFCKRVCFISLANESPSLYGHASLLTDLELLEHLCLFRFTACVQYRSRILLDMLVQNKIKQNYFHYYYY
jgi:hypothetical protein